MVAEEASPAGIAAWRVNLSSKRTGKDTYFWIINNTDETGRMLTALIVRGILPFFTEYKMSYFILTNNPLAAEEFGASHDVEFVDGKLIDVLIRARDMVNSGAVLLNHPLYGSVKPNETPYRSLLVQRAEKPADGSFPAADPESVRLIGNAVNAFSKFIVKKEITNPQLLEDFQVVDLSLLKSAVAAADR